MPDLDVQIQPRAEHIRRREFATIRRGYDPDQVRDFLVAIADSVDSLEEELRRAKSATAPRADRAAPTPEPEPRPAAAVDDDAYDALGKRFAGLLGTADKEAQRLVSEAKAESTRILGEARAEADRISMNAQARAEEARAESLAVLEKARLEAERALTGLSSKREALLGQLQTMQSRLVSAAEELEAVIEKPDEVAMPASPGRPAKGRAAPAPATKAAAKATPTPAPPTTSPQEPVGAEIVDPRYEDLWVSSEDDAVDIPDLSSIEIDFGEERPSSDG